MHFESKHNEIQPRLMSTKYSKQVNGNSLISRPALNRKLDSIPDYKLTFVSAPAGYGKTTTILEWISRQSMPAAFLAIDEHDNNPVIFWRYVFAAFNDALPGIADETQIPVFSKEYLQANFQVNFLIDKLSEVQSEIVFVLDDFYLIINPEVFSSLTYLIRYLPSNVHLVMTSRKTLPSVIDSLFLKTSVLYIGREELRMQRDEILHFFKKRKISIADENIEKIEKDTEGWAASLVVLAMAIENSDNTQNVLAGYIHSMDHYLKQEISSTWPAEKLTFALKTSILDTLCVPLCDAVTGNNNAARMLGDIFEQNGLLFSIDSINGQYRYHRLLKDFLMKTLAEADPGCIAKLHRRAAIWYHKNDDPYAAIEHYIEGGFFEEALVLIDHQMGDILGRSDYATALSWIERMPKHISENCFVSAAVYALHYVDADCMEQAQRWISRMEAIADKTENIQRKNYEQTAYYLIKANFFMRSGQMEQFSSILKEAYSVNAEGNFMLAGFMNLNKADIYFYRCVFGRLARMFGNTPELFYETIGKYREMISVKPGYLPLIVGEYFYENNRLEEVLPNLLSALEEARTAGCAGVLVPAMAGIARLRKAGGDAQGALETLCECEEMLKKINRPHWIFQIHALRARICLDMGDMQHVDMWMEDFKLGLYTEISVPREFELIVFARALLAKKRQTDAEILLKRLLGYAQEKKRMHSQVEILNVLAILSFQKGEVLSSMAYIEDSLRIGAKEGYVRSFMDEGEPMALLLSDYVRSRANSAAQETNGQLKLAEDILEKLNGKVNL